MKNILLLFAIYCYSVNGNAQKCISGDCVNGSGVMLMSDRDHNEDYSDDKYEGQFVNGLREGKGKMSWKYTKNKDFLGDIYEGDWLKGKRTGFGVYYYPDYLYKKWDKIYEGNWLNGYKEGSGKYYESYGYYDGNWQNDERNGLGTYYAVSGRVTKGQWKNGKIIEPYEVYYTNAGKFTGKLKDGKKSGKGQFYLYDGTIVEGKFVDDQLVGNGKITYLDYDRGVYEGEIKNYKASGIGKTTFSGVSVHKGNYLNGKMQGAGTYMGSNGVSFVGEWNEGKQLSGKWYNNFGKKFIMEGTQEEYNALVENTYDEYKKDYARRKAIIDADSEIKRKQEETRWNSLTEEEKLIEKFRCPVCGGKGTLPCEGTGVTKESQKITVSGNVMEVETTKTKTAVTQCTCHMCNGKKYIKTE